MSPSKPTRALVLGGGGVTGIAWELGMLAGLAQAGLDLTAADVVIGTSAGSVVGAQVTGGTAIADLYERQLEPADAEIGARFGVGTMMRLALPIIVPGKPEEKRRRIGVASIKAHPEPPDARLAVIRARLGTDEWPQRDLRITTVDATTGALRVFTRADGVDLVHAVAASCAVPLVWPPVPIDGVPYVDGGVRSPTNADLATGVERVLVLAPLTRGTSRATAIHSQLRGLGTDVWAAAVSPDRPALKAIGRNVLEPSKRADAARAGFRQAETVVEKLTTLWSGQVSTRAQRNRATTR